MFVRRCRDAVKTVKKIAPVATISEREMTRHPMAVAAAAVLMAAVCLQLRTADGYESGAPVLTCRTMVPGHGKPAQTTAAPYRIVTSENVTSSRIRVTLTAPKVNDYFVGFVIEARVPGAEENAVGSFVQVPQDSQTLDCNEVTVSIINAVPLSL